MERKSINDKDEIEKKNYKSDALNALISKIDAIKKKKIKQSDKKEREIIILRHSVPLV